MKTLWAVHYKPLQEVHSIRYSHVKGDTAAELSKSFGKEDREQRSYQEGGPSDHTTYSYQLRELLPPHKIEALSQGYFCGYVADTFKQHVHPKTFCGEVQAGDPPIHNEDIPKILDLPREEIDRLVEENYRQIREDVVNIVSSELEKQNRGEEEGDD